MRATPAPAAQASVAPAPAAQDAPDAASSAVLEHGEGPCRLVVASTPPNATVTLDGAASGSSPLAFNTACGQHRVTISHDGYESMTAWISLAAGRPETIDVPLTRPIHAVFVTTRPSGATIYLDGKIAGHPPRHLDVLGHAPLTLELRKPGYRPEIEHVLAKTSRQQIAVRLTPHHAPAAAAKKKPARR